MNRLMAGETLKDSQKTLAAIGWLSASILHDLRNPLSTMCAGAELLMNLECSSKQARRLVMNMYDAAGRMRQLLADLTNAMREKRCSIETCGLRELIHSASERVRANKQRDQMEIHLDVPDAITVHLIRSHIERVFVHLIANASEAMPDGGALLIRARKSCGYVLIELEDTGPGIPLAISESLFEPLVTAGKRDGFGLGLALAREAVRNHGGDMWVEPAVGARFIIQLPLHQSRFAVLQDAPQ